MDVLTYSAMAPFQDHLYSILLAMPPPPHSSVEKVIKERGLLLAIQASVMKGILSFQLPALAKIILKAMRGECNQIALAVSSLPG